VPFTGNTNFEIIPYVDLPRLKCKSWGINYIDITLTLNTNSVGEFKVDTLSIIQLITTDLGTGKYLKTNCEYQAINYMWF